MIRKNIYISISVVFISISLWFLVINRIGTYWWNYTPPVQKLLESPPNSIFQTDNMKTFLRKRQERIIKHFREMKKKKLQQKNSKSNF